MSAGLNNTSGEHAPDVLATVYGRGEDDADKDFVYTAEQVAGLMGLLEEVQIENIDLHQRVSLLEGQLAEALSENESLLYDKMTSQERLAILDKQSKIDKLTGLSNKNQLDIDLPDFINGEKNAENERKNVGRLAILFLDFDNFHNVNAKYGHQGGDSVLTAGASGIETVIRPADKAYRMGRAADEFAILMPRFGAGLTEDEVQASLDKRRDETEEVVGSFLREGLKELEEEHDNSETERLYVGVTVAGALHISGEEPKQFLARVDRMMFDRKKNKKEHLGSEYTRI